MSCSAQIYDGPLPPRRPRPAPDGVGAILVFEGVVRAREGEGLIDALTYEAYEPMAVEMIRKIAEALLREHELTSIEVEHSRGRVPVGKVSFRLTIQSRHREEGLRAAAAFIDQLKRDVPIWKRPVWRGGCLSDRAGGVSPLE